jgi:ATP-binding cassette subfamily F protein uup
VAAADGAKQRKLSYKEQRELETLPDRIDSLEAEQRSLAELFADAGVFTRDPQRAAQARARYAEVERELNNSLERWEELGSKG